MKIYVIGARGFPEVQGGIEKHCEEIYPLISNKFDITVLTTKEPKSKIWKNIKFLKIPTLKKKSLEKIVYAFISLIYCIVKRPDIVHIQGLNSALVIPLLKIFRLKVIYTQHSMDYLYPKWGKFAKRILLLSEFCGSKADAVTVVSPIIQKHFKVKYDTKSFLTYNGVNFSNEIIFNDNYSFDKSILEKKYLLFVGRITPEKDLITLIKAFNNIQNNDLYLVIVGAADHDDDYINKVFNLVSQNQKILMLGMLSNHELPMLYKNAKLFVLPSQFEAFPIVPLEAMYFNTKVLLSNIDALRQFDFLLETQFFNVGNVDSLSNAIKYNLENNLSEYDTNRYKLIIQERYHWSETANVFINIYKSIFK